jgi:ABC-2 type transport system ATP-binding protein
VKTIESVIQLDNVSMKFKKHIIFEDLYFQCQAKEIIGIVGENLNLFLDLLFQIKEIYL